MVNDEVEPPGRDRRGDRNEGGLDEQIAALAGVRTRDLWLPPEALRLYREATSRSARTLNRHFLIWTAGLNALCALFDPFILPAGFVALAAAARFMVSAIFLLAAFLTIRATRLELEGWAVVGACVFTSLLAGAFSAYADPSTIERYVVQCVFLNSAAIVVSRISWRETVVLTGAATAIATVFLCLQPLGSGTVAARAQTLLFLDASLVGFALVKRAFIQLQYRVFVLGMRDRMRLGEIESANRRLAEIARTDPLTGVANRRRFDEISREGQLAEAASLLMVDIDNFKHLNDRLGHAAGDACLVAVARLMSASVRTGVDLVARVGGEEFVALLPGCDAAAAALVAERLRADVAAERLPNPGGIGGVLTVSVGVATARGGRIEDLVSAAEAALYASKAAGRNTIRLASDLPPRHAA